ncbi:MAG: three-Cys-motif partner protein TcmP [Hormoscilla sp.]
MTDNSFFEKPTEQSRVKAEIVAKYFWAWAKVIIPRAKKKRTNIAYIDLCSGPGIYEDGSQSTPLLILKRAIANPNMREMLVTIFKDVDSQNTQSLQQAINSLPDIDSLRHRPMILNREVGEELAGELEKVKLYPTLSFVDLWGYKGLSLSLLGTLIKGWGCDCIFLFNYNRSNMALNNPVVEKRMDSLFGKERADTLREKIKPMQPKERESTIVEAICQGLNEVGGSHVQEFKFKNASGSRTSHYLIFVSKNQLGHSIMKDIMAQKSSIFSQGVPSFEYNPVPIQLSLFDPKPLDELEDMLLDKFAGRTMTMIEVHNEHHVGTPYTDKNYKDALRKLEEEGKIIADPPASQRRKNKGKLTFADSVKVTFPPKQ